MADFLIFKAKKQNFRLFERLFIKIYGSESQLYLKMNKKPEKNFFDKSSKSSPNSGENQVVCDSRDNERLFIIKK